MKKSTISLSNESRLKLALPAISVMLCLDILILAFGLQVSPTKNAQGISLLLALGSPIYIATLFYFIQPHLLKHPSLQWPLAIFHGLVLAYLTNASIHVPDEIFVIYCIIAIVLSTLLIGRLPTYLMTTIATIMAIVFKILNGDLLQTYIIRSATLPLIAIIITETLLRMQNALYRQLQRLETLNNVARNLASSLEIHQVISLVSAAIQNTLSADTYYVGLMNHGRLRLELFYDDGEFFPPMEVNPKDSLAGWVVKNRKSMLIRNTKEDDERNGITPTIIGKPRDSLSWMGAPLESSGRVLGMVAVASYSKHAFDNADLELLENFAQQAAMAIDNAYHHAEVETKSKLDSLTGVYNHGSFLKILAAEAENSCMLQQQMSIIMLDIDNFKHYNDTYGHLLGDQVLQLLIQAIQSHIKSSDKVGRWGGEEFIILLPNTKGSRAVAIANRIRQSLSEMHITDREHKTIPCPTISQGIAVFSEEEMDIYRLVDLADQRLYIAKNRGRDQVEPSESFWDESEDC